MCHTLSDNRHGLIARAMVTIANGFAEREANKVMIVDAKQIVDEGGQVTLLCLYRRELFPGYALGP